MTVEYLARLEPGWFVLDVMRAKPREKNWLALMIDVDPDELKTASAMFRHYFMFEPLTTSQGTAGCARDGFAFRAGI
jgi:hypothetical protein